MKRFTLIALTLAFSASALAIEPRDIMQKVYDREDGNNALMDMDMVLIDNKGDQRTRTGKS